MIFCTDTDFIHEHPNKFIINLISSTNFLTLTTIINKSVSAKLHKKTHFISAASTEHPSDNGGQKIIVSEILIHL